MKKTFAYIFLMLESTDLDGTFHCSQKVVKIIFKYESRYIFEELGC